MESPPLPKSSYDTGLADGLQSFIKKISCHGLLSPSEQESFCLELDEKKFPIFLLLWWAGLRPLPTYYTARVSSCPVIGPSLKKAKPSALRTSSPDPQELEELSSMVNSPPSKPPDPLSFEALNALEEERATMPSGLFARATPASLKKACHAAEPVLDSYIELRKKFMLYNMRMVIRYARTSGYDPSQTMDYIQEGIQGLSKAIDRFGVSLGHRFSTYATWWIKQSIKRYITESCSTIRLPTGYVELRNKIHNCSESYIEKHGKPPSRQFLAESFGVPEARVSQVLERNPTMVNLDAPIDSQEREGSSLADRISDPEAVDPVDIASDEYLKDRLEELLDSLSPREKNIVVLRYGIGDGTRHTLEEIGRILDLTRERIRQVEAKAIRRLRHPRQLRILLGDSAAT